MATNLFVLLIDRLGKLLLEEHDDFLDVLARDHVHGDAECLPTNVKIGAGQDAEDLHGQIVKDALVCLAQLVDLLQDDQLDVVVRLLDAQLDELGGGSLDGDRVVC